MSTEFRPPPETSATLEDFSSSGWHLSAPSQASYFSWSNALANAGFQACQAGMLSKSRVLWLLADACAMRLDPANLNEPFFATGSDHFGRPLGLDSFPEDDIVLLSLIYPEIADPLLRARVADIVWLRTRPKKDRNAAAAAIDAYVQTPLSPEDWRLDGRNCWRRAIKLSLQLGSSTERLAAEISSRLQAAAEAALGQEDLSQPGISMAQVLLELGIARDAYQGLAEMLSARGESLCRDGNYYQARHCLAAASQFFLATRDQGRQADMAYAIAQTYVGEATQRISGAYQSYTVAASLYTDAIHALREIPKGLRAVRGGDVEMSRLYGLLKEASARSLDEYAPIRTEPIDIKDEMAAARSQVADKDLIDALYELAACIQFVSPASAEHQTRYLMNQVPSMRLFGIQTTASDGRVVDSTGTSADLDDGSDASKEIVKRHMVRGHQQHMRFSVASTIAPILQELLLDHLVDEEDLGNIVAQSGIVTADRVRLVAKGLKAGFDGAFDVALHLLVPQLEHLVRMHLQGKGVKTTALSKDGVQMEVGLSTLADTPEMIDVFGPELTFEIQAVFCDQAGPNLRNDLAHGLLSDGATQSAESLYAWWMIFKMVFSNYWMADTGSKEEAIAMRRPHTASGN